jgi:predicted phage-related endonuclease
VSFTIIDAEQRSPEWFAARLGRLTGSRAADMLATIKAGEAAARRDLRTQLVCERLTGQVQEEPFINAAMQRGIECEPLAFAAYEAHTGTLVQRSGFVAHDIHMAGCSLDGHVEGFAGLIELKCPKSTTHLRYLRGGIVPSDYIPQITHNLWITGAEWADFVSWDDRFPPEFQLFIKRLTRHDELIADYERKALAFLAEVDLEANSLATMMNPTSVLRAVTA